MEKHLEVILSTETVVTTKFCNISDEEISRIILKAIDILNDNIESLPLTRKALTSIGPWMSFMGRT